MSNPAALSRIEVQQHEFAESGIVIDEELYPPELCQAAVKDKKGIARYFGRSRALDFEGQISNLTSVTLLEGSILGFMINRINSSSHFLGFNSIKGGHGHEVCLTELPAKSGFQLNKDHDGLIVAPLEQEIHFNNASVDVGVEAGSEYSRAILISGDISRSSG
jgi:hypothetical protein